jgi:hypothetical protein
MKAFESWQWWLGTMVLSAIAGWFLLASPPEDVPVVNARHDAWQLPPLPRRPDLMSMTAGVIDAPFWGGAEAATAAPPPEDTRWRIAAIFGRAKERTVLVEFADPAKKPLRLHVGDKFPSGHKILAIDERDVSVKIEGKVYRFGVERSEF